MAGSFNHLRGEDGNYAGIGLIENMGDASEAIEQMFFMLMFIVGGWEAESRLEMASEAYYRCARGEDEWPAFMRPGVENR